MSDARGEILGRLRRATPAVVVAPAVAGTPATTPEERVARFSAAARAAAATVARVPADAHVPGAVADYLEREGLPLAACLSAEPRGLAPGRCGPLLCEARAPRPDGDTLVSGCLAAIAEEGAVVLASAATHAPETAFLAATHVVVVRAAQLVDTLAALWPRLRALGEPPRMVNIVLGPSRTADLGVPSRLGAHGPLRLHVVIVDEPAAGSPPD